MRITIPTPRLLPATIAAIACLLAMKSVDVVRAAVPPGRMDLMPRLTELVDGPPRDPPPPGRSMKSERKAIPAPPPAAAQGPPPVSDSEKAVLLELRQRRTELDAREKAVTERESVLTAAEQKLTSRVDELQTLQTKLEGLEAGRKQREDASWQGLVKLYESMKPREAATIFNDLAMPTLLQIVDRMKDAKAAAVLAAMNPDKARDVTAQLAQMRLREAAVPAPSDTTKANQPGG